MTHASLNRSGMAPFVRGASRRIYKSAPELWAEQERRRLMLEAEKVTVTYRRASALPPQGELRRLICNKDKLQANELRELRFIGETCVKMFAPTGQPYWGWLKREGPRIASLLQESPCWVADVGGGVVLGFVVSQGSLVHALYVKYDFRGLGIGLGLLREAGVTVPIRVTRATTYWRRWTEHHGIEWEMVPSMTGDTP